MKEETTSLFVTDVAEDTSAQQIGGTFGMSSSYPRYTFSVLLKGDHPKREVNIHGQEYSVEDALASIEAIKSKLYPDAVKCA